MILSVKFIFNISFLFYCNGSKLFKSNSISNNCIQYRCHNLSRDNIISDLKASLHNQPQVVNICEFKTKTKQFKIFFLISINPSSYFKQKMTYFYTIARTKLNSNCLSSAQRESYNVFKYLFQIFKQIHFKLFSYPCHRNKIYCIHNVKYNTDSQWIQTRHSAVHLPSVDSLSNSLLCLTAMKLERHLSFYKS